MSLFQLISKGVRDPKVVLATFGTMVGTTFLAANWPLTTLIAVGFCCLFFGSVLYATRTR